MGEDKKEIGYLTFERDGYAFFEIQGQIMGGKEFIFDGKKAKMTFEVHENTSPIEVDLVITMQESGVQSTMLCIVDFIDDDTMNFAISFSEERPKDFKSDDAILLKRVK
jgi:hypothetical protein